MQKGSEKSLYDICVCEAWGVDGCMTTDDI